MRKKALSKMNGNEKLAKTIFNEDGRILLNPGVAISKSYIDKFTDMGFNHLYVEDELSEGIKFEDYLSDTIRQKCKKDIKVYINKFLTSKVEKYDTLIDCGQLILDDIMANKGVIYEMDDLRLSNEGIIPHIISVTALVAIVGKKMGINILRLKDIVSGAILHDIGKLSIMKESGLNIKKMNLIDAKTLLEHPKRGYEMLGKLYSFSAISKIMVLKHHENCDGSGYPMRSTKKDIHESARILRICDTFDNMIAGNTDSKKPILSNQIFDYLYATKEYFDREIVDVLGKVVSVYPTGTVVKLSTGENGIVSNQNLGDLKKPIVRIFQDKNGKNYAEHQEINLKDDLKVTITEIIDI